MNELTQADLNIMRELEMKSGVITMNEILNCVKDQKWQAFRKSLKGLSTAEKLRKLRGYKQRNSGRCVDVQVENYLNALRRGGQLPAKGKK